MKLNVIDCHNCGLCCMHMRIPVFTTEKERKRVPKELLREIDDYVNSPRYVDNDYPCMWLDLSTGKCKHHEIRPQVCRDFEVGSKGCKMFREEAGLPI